LIDRGIWNFRTIDVLARIDGGKDKSLAYPNIQCSKRCSIEENLQNSLQLNELHRSGSLVIRNNQNNFEGLKHQASQIRESSNENGQHIRDISKSNSEDTHEISKLSPEKIAQDWKLFK